MALLNILVFFLYTPFTSNSVNYLLLLYTYNFVVNIHSNISWSSEGGGIPNDHTWSQGGGGGVWSRPKYDHKILEQPLMHLDTSFTFLRTIHISFAEKSSSLSKSEKESPNLSTPSSYLTHDSYKVSFVVQGSI